MLARRRPTRRRGMTIVESTLVLAIFLMMLFGIFEYARFLLVLHVTTNAARDGARYAAVNVNKPVTLDTADYTVTTSSGTQTYQNITQYTKDRTGGVYNQMSGFAVTVFAVDGPALASNPANPVARSGYTWNQVTFPDKVAVKVSGTYTPLLPSFLNMPTSIPISITSVTGGES